MGITYYYTCTTNSTTNGYWCDSSTTDGTPYTYYYIYPTSPTYAPPPETEAQRQSRLARERANQKAEELLREMFGEEYGILVRDGSLLVNSEKHHGLRYRISRDATRRIDVLDASEKIVDSLCVVHQIGCPNWDMILTKIMLAKFDEDRLQQVANHFRS